jgi:glycosyltransferase involved in cell wall biosynthesis
VPSGFSFVVAVPARLNIEQLPVYPNLQWHILPDANFIVWEQVLIPWLAHRVHADVIHFPYNTRAITTGGIRCVTTVHDVLFLTQTVPLRRLKVWIAAQYSRTVFSFATRRSDVVVSVSDTTRSSLAGLGLKASTVYNTVDGFISQLVRRRARPARRYILHRGGHQSHRNTGRVIRAFRRVRSLIPNLELKIVGDPAGMKRWSSDVDNDENVHFLPWLTDPELAVLYADSSCVVAASLQEGFGLPIIEGFGLGSPVITSDIDPMREVAGDAALLVDPYSETELEDAMLSVLRDPDLAASLVEKGRIRQGVFSSTQLAEKMFEVYATV